MRWWDCPIIEDLMIAHDDDEDDEDEDDEDDDDEDDDDEDDDDDANGIVQ